MKPTPIIIISKWWLLTILMVVFHFTLVAQPPTISSFTPASGTIGDFVTITGTNFSSNQPDNIVTFNGVRAEVLMSTSTTLLVIPKNGTTSGSISVTVAGNSVTSAASFTVISNFGVMQFASPTTYNVSGLNGRLHETDFNGDGNKDFVVLVPSGVSVFLGDGLGGFTAQPQINLPGVPVDVLVKDFNQDNRIDIVTTNNTTQQLTIFLGNGNGTFAAGVNYIIGFGPQRVASGDFNHDGFDDLIITVYAGFNVFFGTGAGTFTSLTAYAMGAYPVDLAVNDFNNDGNLDAAIGNGWDPNVSIFLGSAAGTFTFSDLISGVYTGDQQIISEDFNNDGKNDLVAGLGTTSFSLILGNGDGTFGTPQFLAADFARAFHARDINGDNKTDLVVPNFSTNTLKIFTNDGLANFSLGQTISTLSGPGPVLLTDLNGDHLLDMISCSYGQSYLTVRMGVLIPAITSFAPTSGPSGTTVTITGSNFSSTPSNNVVFFGAVKANVTAATSTQLTVTVPIGSTFEPISVQVAGLTGYSRNPFLVTFPGGGSVNTCSFEPAVSFATAVGPGALMTADFDGDGKVDAGVSNRISRTIYVYRNTAIAGQVDASSFASPLSIATPPSGDPYNAKTADLDGDGKLDIVLTVAGTSEVVIFRNTSTIGSLSFDNYISFPAGADPLHAAIADFDADGKPDIAAVNRFSNTLSIYKNTTSTGSFSASSFAAKVDFAVGTEPYVVRAADLNSDGKPDIVVTNLVSNSLFVFENTTTARSINSGSFASPVTLITGTTPHTSSLTDFDRDGLIDIAIANIASNTVSVFRNVSAGGPISSASFAAKVDFPAGATSVDFAAGDVDGDGKADIAITNQGTNKVAILKNTSTPGSIDATSFASIVSFTSGTLPASIMLADIDGDGKVDMLNTNMNGQSLNIYRNITDAPPPTISLFAPAAGATGSPVTITGTNFNSTPASNIVTFNGVSAVVTASTATSIITSVPAGATSGPITVTIGCSQATSATNFNVCTVPASPGVTGASRCGAGTLTLTANGGVPGAYVWYTAASGGSALPGETNAAFVTPSLSTTTTYFVSINNGGCESTRTPVTATINAVPAVPSVTPGSGCSPSSSITLLASGGSTGQYRWYTAVSGGVAVAGQTNSSFITPTISASTTYYVSINDGVCESARIPVLAEIKSCVPQIKTAILTATVGGEASLPLPALVTTVGSALDVSSFNVIVPPISGAKTSITAGTIHIDYAGIAFAGTDRFTIRACDMVGNCGQQELTVDVQGEITVFNAISPNGDGKNETFFVQNIELLPDTRQNHMTIFNRWGSIVYEVDNYDNNERVFQGLGNDGDKLPAGTYFYRIDFGSGLKPVTGFISLRQ